MREEGRRQRRGTEPFLREPVLMRTGCSSKTCRSTRPSPRSVWSLSLRVRELMPPRRVCSSPRTRLAGHGEDEEDPHAPRLGEDTARLDAGLGPARLRVVGAPLEEAEDVLAAARLARDWSGGLPVHVLGVSMGAFAPCNAAPRLGFVRTLLLESP